MLVTSANIVLALILGSRPFRPVISGWCRNGAGPLGGAGPLDGAGPSSVGVLPYHQVASEMVPSSSPPLFDIYASHPPNGASLFVESASQFEGLGVQRSGPGLLKSSSWHFTPIARLRAAPRGATLPLTIIHALASLLFLCSLDPFPSRPRTLFADRGANRARPVTGLEGFNA